MFKNINKKRIIIGLVILVVIFLVFNGLFNKKEEKIKTEKVVRGTLVQEVSETGTVESPEEVELRFKTAGRIETINVKVGDTVEKNANLISLDKNQLWIQLEQVQAALVVAEAQYNKSESTRDAAQQDLDDAYQDALNTLDDAYLKIYNAYNVVNSLQSSYFSTVDQEGIKITENKALITSGLNTIKPLLDTAKSDSSQEKINKAVSETINSLKNVSDALKTIRETCDQGIYYTKISSTDKTAIDNQRSYINTSLTNTTNSQQAITSAKIDLQEAENDIVYYEAKTEEAKADINYYHQQIWDATIRAPIKGIVTKVEKKVGETVQVSDAVVSMISLDPLQVKVDIYEEDIVKIKEGNAVDIKVAAFPEDVLKGKVVAIAPAGKLVEGVVYYEVTIAFDELREDLPAGASLQAMQAGIRPEMTADVVIKTASKDNILIISKSAIGKNGGATVRVFKNGNKEIREVEIGLEGNDNKVEVISGLIEGEEVIIR